MNSTAASAPTVDSDDVIFELAGAICIYRSGRVERLRSDELVPPSLDPTTGVQSKDIADALWLTVLPGTTGLDDPRINPVAEGAPSLAAFGCQRVLVCVAERDMLRERGRVYYEKLKESGWEGEAEFLESKGEDHCFFIIEPGSLKAEEFMERMASFFNKS